MKTRMTRINDEIAHAVAKLIRTEMSDPRLGIIVSVLRAETTSDLKTCKIFVSVLGNEHEQQSAMKALANATGFVRKHIAGVINLRQTPEIKFIYDDAIEHGMKMLKKIEALVE